LLRRQTLTQPVSWLAAALKERYYLVSPQSP